MGIGGGRRNWKVKYGFRFIFFIESSFFELEFIRELSVRGKNYLKVNIVVFCFMSRV